MLLRTAGPARTVAVDWDAVEVRVPGRLPGYSRRVKVDLADPLGWTRQDLEHVFTRGEEPELGDLIDLLTESQEDAVEVSSANPGDRSSGASRILQIPADTQSWRNRNGNA